MLFCASALLRCLPHPSSTALWAGAHASTGHAALPGAQSRFHTTLWTGWEATQRFPPYPSRRRRAAHARARADDALLLLPLIARLTALKLTRISRVPNRLSNSLRKLKPMAAENKDWHPFLTR